MPLPKNVVTYLKHYGLDGFDIDWEWHYLSDDTTQAQFKTTFSAVGPALRACSRCSSEWRVHRRKPAFRREKDKRAMLTFLSAAHQLTRPF